MLILLAATRVVVIRILLVALSHVNFRYFVIRIIDMTDNIRCSKARKACIAFFFIREKMCAGFLHRVQSHCGVVSHVK